MYVVRTPDRARDRGRAGRGRHRLGVVLRDAAAPAARDALPRLRARARCPRPSARRRTTSPCPCGAASAPTCRSRSSRPCSPPAGAAHEDDSVLSPSAELGRTPCEHRSTDTRSGRSRSTRASSRSRGRSPGCCASTRAGPVYYDRYLDWQIILVVVAIQLTVFALAGFYNRWWRYVSTRDMWSALRGVGVRVARHLPRLHAVRAASGARADRRLVHRPAPLPRVRRRLAAARPDADRAARSRGRSSRAARRRSSSGPATRRSS